MKFLRPLFLLAILSGAAALCSCSSTAPTPADMDRFYVKAEEMAQAQIAILDRQLQSGQISRESYEDRVAYIRQNIPIKASELAWARHEIAEAQKRQLGIPTGDSKADMALPSASSAGGFYHPAGSAPGGNSTPALPAGGRSMYSSGASSMGRF